MTKSIYEQLKADSRFTIASKVWYKEFPFRVSFKGWDMFDGGFLNLFHRNSNIKRQMSRLDHEYKSRNDHCFNLYLKEEQALSDVIKYYNDDIIEIQGPLSQNHKDLMVQDLTQSVRKKLFYNKYRYKVSCHMYKFRDEMDQFIDIADFVTSSFEPDTYYINSTIRQYPRLKALEDQYKNVGSGSAFRRPRWSTFIPYSSTGSVYFIDYSDVCTMHLMFKNIITSTTKVVLIEDLE